MYALLTPKTRIILVKLSYQTDSRGSNRPETFGPQCAPAITCRGMTLHGMALHGMTLHGMTLQHGMTLHGMTPHGMV